MQFIRERKEERRFQKEVNESKEYYKSSYDGQIKEVVSYLRV